MAISGFSVPHLLYKVNSNTRKVDKNSKKSDSKHFNVLVYHYHFYLPLCLTLRTPSINFQDGSCI